MLKPVRGLQMRIAGTCCCLDSSGNLMLRLCKQLQVPTANIGLFPAARIIFYVCSTFDRAFGHSHKVSMLSKCPDIVNTRIGTTDVSSIALARACRSTHTEPQLCRHCGVVCTELRRSKSPQQNSMSSTLELLYESAERIESFE